jgi:hypothetical protein
MICNPKLRILSEYYERLQNENANQLNSDKKFFVVFGYFVGSDYINYETKEHRQ